MFTFLKTAKTEARCSLSAPRLVIFPLASKSFFSELNTFWSLKHETTKILLKNLPNHKLKAKGHLN